MRFLRCAAILPVVDTRPTAPCCATTPTGSRGLASTWAPTTPRASSTSGITCCCRRTSVGGPLDYPMGAILRSVERSRPTTGSVARRSPLIADLLILKDDMPRARKLLRQSGAEPRRWPAPTAAGTGSAPGGDKRLENSRMEEIFRPGCTNSSASSSTIPPRRRGHRAVSDVI